MNGDYEVTLVLSGVKVEHVGEALRRLRAVDFSFVEEGLSIGSSYSVERDRDGVERWHTWVDADGNIKDIQPWQERKPTPDYDPHIDYPERFTEGPI